MMLFHSSHYKHSTIGVSPSLALRTDRGDFFKFDYPAFASGQNPENKMNHELINLLSFLSKKNIDGSWGSEDVRAIVSTHSRRPYVFWNNKL